MGSDIHSEKIGTMLLMETIKGNAKFVSFFRLIFESVLLVIKVLIFIKC